MRSRANPERRPSSSARPSRSRQRNAWGQSLGPFGSSWPGLTRPSTRLAARPIQSLIQRLIQIQPARIRFKDQSRLPGARPMLDVRLALNGIGDSLVKLRVDESLEPVPLGESRHECFTMFIGASTDVRGDAGVENAVRAVGYDVDPAAGHSRLTAWMAGSSPAMTVAEPGCPGPRGKSIAPQLHPVVAPQVSHLRHVPFRTMVKLPHSGQDSPT